MQREHQPVLQSVSVSQLAPTLWWILAIATLASGSGAGGDLSTSRVCMDLPKPAPNVFGLGSVRTTDATSHQLVNTWSMHSRARLRGGTAAGEDAETSIFLDPEALEKFVWSPELSSSGFDPLFMHGMSEAEQEAARAEWIQRIMEDDDDVEDLMEYHKEQGNKVVGHARRLQREGNRNYTKLMAEAANHYSAALLQNTTQVLLRATCFANRAACHLERSNFGHCIRDCHAVFRIHNAACGDLQASNTIPPHLAAALEGIGVDGKAKLVQLARKAVCRAAKASCILGKYEEAMEWCERAPAVECGEEEGGTESMESFRRRVEEARAEARKGLAAEEEERKRREELQRRREAQKQQVQHGMERKLLRNVLLPLLDIWDRRSPNDEAAPQETVRKGGVLVGVTLYPEVLRNQLVDVALDTSVDAKGEKSNTLWPLMLVYEEFRQTDFLRQCPESSNLFYHLNTVFDTSAPPPPWDPQRTYSPFNAAVYLIAYQTPLLVEGRPEWVVDDETGRRKRPTWIRVDTWLTVGEMLRVAGHIVPGFPVLHVVREGSKFEEHMLQRPPGEFLPISI